MTLKELEAAVNPALSWDEVTRLMGMAWALALKQHKADPMKLYYSWETIMHIYWTQYES